jgi:hypothetical protein
MSVVVAYTVEGHPRQTVKASDVDLEQTVGDFVSNFTTANGLDVSEFELSFNGQVLPEDTTLGENGIQGSDETLELYTRHVPA